MAENEKPLDEAARGRLQEVLAELEKADEAIAKVRLTFDRAIASIDAVRNMVLEQHQAEVAGTCVGCSRLLLVGDKGYSYDDGPLCCEACSPTWGDAEENWTALSKYDDRRAAFLKSLEQHLAAGGTRADKLPLFEL